MDEHIYQDSVGNYYFIDEFGKKTYVVNKPKKKKGFFRSIADGFTNWFDGLSFNQQVGFICAGMFVSGMCYGSAFQQMADKKKTKKVRDVSYAFGVQQGRLEAYKDVATTNPFVGMDTENAKVTKF